MSRRNILETVDADRLEEVQECRVSSSKLLNRLRRPSVRFQVLQVHFKSDLERDCRNRKLHWLEVDRRADYACGPLDGSLFVSCLERFSTVLTLVVVAHRIKPLFAPRGKPYMSEPRYHYFGCDGLHSFFGFHDNLFAATNDA